MPVCTVSGVPEIVTVLLELEPILRPWGNKPVDTDQRKGPTPPAASTVWVYVAPIVPSLKAVVVIDRRGGAAALPPPQLVMEKPQVTATAIEATKIKYWNLQRWKLFALDLPSVKVGAKQIFTNEVGPQQPWSIVSRTLVFAGQFMFFAFVVFSRCLPKIRFSACAAKDEPSDATTSPEINITGKPLVALKVTWPFCYLPAGTVNSLTAQA